MTNGGTQSNGCLLLWIATGILFAAAGFLTAVLGNGGPIAVNFSALAVSVGFAIVLGAVGTKATARFGTHGFAWTIAGPGAAAVILLTVFHYYLNPALTKLGSIEIIPPYFEKVADLRIVDDLPLYEYRDSANKSIHFIMLKEKFNHTRVSVQVDTTEKDEGRAWFEMVGDGDEIIRRHLGKSWEESARWMFDYPNHVIKDGNYIIFREISDQNKEVIPLKKADLSSHYWNDWFTNAALAEPLAKNDDGLDPAALARDLTDEDPRVRRNARDALISLGPAAIQPMTEAWRKEPDNYKMRLGTVIVMNGMLRNNEHIASKISENLNDEDISLLVNTLSDTDKTIRLQATEFLYALKDTRTVQSSLYALRAG